MARLFRHAAHLLEAEPTARAGALLGDAGWHVGKHTPSA